MSISSLQTDIPDANTFVEAVNRALQGVTQTSDNLVIAKVLVGTVIVLATIVVVHFVVKITRRFLQRVNEALPVTIFVNIERICLWALAAYLLLSACFDVDASGIIAALGVGGIAISLGLQDTISNMIGGLQLSTMGILRKGDHVKIGNVEGVVHDVAWRQTTITGFAGETTIVPNSVINNNSLTILPPVRKVVITQSLTHAVVSAYHARDIDMAALSGIVEQRIDEALQAPKPKGLGLKLQTGTKLFLRAATEFGVSASAVVWIAEDEEFDKLLVESVISSVFEDVCAEVPYSG